MKQAFIEKKFKTASLEMIKTINDILEKYRSQGFKLSLRQLYYQLVAGAIKSICTALGSKIYMRE